MSIAQHSEARHSGIDLSHVDEGTRAQDDLFEHVNGRWLATHEIPADRALDGAFRTLADKAEVDVRTIIEEAAASDAPAGTDARKIGDLFTSFMDTERIEALGLTPIATELDAITGAADRAALAAVGAGALATGGYALLGSDPAGAEEQSYDIPGTYEFVVPANVASVGVEACGAGGGTGGSNTHVDSKSAEAGEPDDLGNGGTQPGGEGGNGAALTGILAVTPGETLVVTVGGAGAVAHYGVGLFDERLAAQRRARRADDAHILRQ